MSDLLDAGFPGPLVVAAALSRAKGIVEGLPRSRDALFDDRATKIAFAALMNAFPSAGAPKLAAALAGAEARGLSAASAIAATRLWWPEEAVEELVRTLKAHRPRRAPKPLPADFDLKDPSLPRCGTKPVAAGMEIVRKVVSAKPKKSFGIAQPWNPVEAHRPKAQEPQHIITHVVMGDPAPGRSAWAERQRQAEARSREARA